MRIAITTAVLTLLAGAGHAAGQTPQRFDLACEGTERRYESRRFGEADGPERTAPWRGRLRVDTTLRHWCLDRCEMAFPMPGAGAPRLSGGMFAAPLQPPPGTLVISDSGESNQEWDSRYTVLYRPAGRELRMDSHRMDHIRGRRTTSVVEARCVAAPFSGFPQLRGR